MKTRRSVTLAGAGALALLLSSASAFAAPQRADVRDGRSGGGYSDNNGNYDNRGGHDNGVNTDNGGPNNRNFGNRGNGNGANRSVDQRGNNNRSHDNRGNDNRGYDNRGYDNRGYNNRGYDRGYHNNRGYAASVLRGIVERIDYRSGSVWVREGRQMTRVDVRGGDLRGLRRGDRVALSGQWVGGGFTAWSLDRAW
jgi:hypothetical protein